MVAWSMDEISTENHSPVSNGQQVIIGPGNGLVPNGDQILDTICHP